MPTPKPSPESAHVRPAAEVAPLPATQPPARARGRHDYAGLGFMCGLEIHQQLATGKLHCRCPGDVIDADDVPARTAFMLTRRLRPTESELGEMDPAARAEARRGLLFVYHGIQGHACLVDADEEPPHAPDTGAMEIALTMAELLGSRPVDEVQFMRKIVIDGSNTAGFQRTALVALGGHVQGVGVQTLAVEEDSCRKLDGIDDGAVHYTLDRLGIPLIEIATTPDIRDAEHAKEVAARIGALLRATGRVRRGLGTIRQDLNVSIRDGARVEIKGVQDLRSIPRVADAEIDRQLHMLKVRETLRQRGVDDKRLLKLVPTDLSATLRASTSKVVADALKSGGAVLAVPLPGFAGLLKGATKDGPRLGRELAGYARRQARVRGVFHSDELPGYGITEAEVASVRKALDLGADDAFVLSAAPQAVGRRALDAVLERARLALVGVPREVRNALPDDSTEYLRPLPGAARMYPETDVRPFAVTPSLRKRIRAHLPELPEAAAKRLAATHGLSGEIAGQLVAEGHVALFDAVMVRVARPTELARFLLQTAPELASAGTPVDKLDEAAIVELLSALEGGRFAKEALGTVAAAYAKNPAGELVEAIRSAGAGAVGRAEVEAVVARVVAGQAALVKERGAAAAGPLMGAVMKELRGKADGKLVAEVLAAAIKKTTG